MKIGVIGTGTMGSGIVQAFAQAGFTVVMKGISDAELQSGQKIISKNLSKLVEKDPLSKELRLGKTLFNNGNANNYEKTPLVGDFWMSCNSCHFEGFNFTNGFLFTDTKLDKKDDASIGHDNIDKGYISKTPLADYVRIARDTQGGMGEDPKSDLENIKVPTLIVYGDNDMYTLEHGIEIHNAIKNTSKSYFSFTKSNITT